MKPSAGLRPAPECLELQSETDLALPVRGTGVVGCTGDLAKRTVADIRIRTTKDGAVEGIEVVDLEQTGKSFADEELLTSIEVFVVERRVPEFAVVPWDVAQSVRRSWRKRSRVEDRAHDFREVLLLGVVVAGSSQLDSADPIRTIEAVRERRTVLTDAESTTGFIIQNPAHLPSTENLTGDAMVVEVLDRKSVV